MTNRQLNDLVMGASALIFALVLLMLGDGVAQESAWSVSRASGVAAALIIALQALIFVRLGRVLDAMSERSAAAPERESKKDAASQANL